MSNITFHRRHMTAVPTDLLLDPMISIEAKAIIELQNACARERSKHGKKTGERRRPSPATS